MPTKAGAGAAHLPPGPVDPAALTIVPANEASREDLGAIFGVRGYPAYCQCQRFKIGPSGWTEPTTAERMARLEQETHCGYPSAPRTSGLVAYLFGEPVGWCAVEPRSNYTRLPPQRVVFKQRGEDPADESVWAVTCFVTRAGYRRRGITRVLAAATVGFARERGARALEAYPMITEPGAGGHLGRDPRRHPQHLRGRRVHRGLPPDAPAGRDADRLLESANRGGTNMTAAPIILVPGFWLGAWAWDEVAATLRADGHEVRAITLPGQASKDEDRSGITFGDHVDAIIDGGRGGPAPGRARGPQRVRVQRVRRERPHPGEDRGHGLRRHRAREAAARRVAGGRQADGLGGHRRRGEPQGTDRGADGHLP